MTTHMEMYLGRKRAEFAASVLSISRISLLMFLTTVGPSYMIPVYNWTVVAPALIASHASRPDDMPPQALIVILYPTSLLTAETISNI